MRLIIALIFVLASFAGATVARAQTTIDNVRVGQHDSATRLVIDLNQSTGFQLFTLGTPYRVVLDLPNAEWKLARNAIQVNRGLVRSVRFGRFNRNVSRVVVDLNAPIIVKQAYLLPPQGADGYRIVVDLGKVASGAFRETTLRLVGPNTPAPAGTAVAKRQEAPREPAPPVAVVPKPSADVQPPPPNAIEADAGDALNRALDVPEPPPSRPGSERPIIVVDPGHGGADPGAVASGGVLEKTITLAVGKELTRQLRAAGYPVKMTRERDQYISLSSRVDYAREVGAGLFVSLHADSHSNGRIQGASIYTLSDKASDKEAERLARRENKADIVSGVDLDDGYDAEVTRILISLVQQSTMNCSATFAAMLVPSLGKVAGLLGRTHRFAGFRVLKAPDVPSVLVELGYLSNKKDLKRLQDKGHRRALAAEIVTTVNKFVNERDC